MARIFLLSIMLFVAFRADGVIMSDPVQIGSGSNFQWVTTGPDGSIHVCYNGKYRTGSSITAMGSEQTATPDNGSNFANPKIDVDPNGRPHIVYQKGTTSSGRSSYYTSRVNGAWITPERFALNTEVSSSCTRAGLPDLAADAAGNVLACFWANENTGSLQRAVYRWRNSSGVWGSYKGGLTSYHAATPKVEEHDGKFYLHYSKDDYNKMLAGPINPLADISVTQTHFGSSSINRSYQNEGTNFSISSTGKVVAAGNFRKTASGGGIGVWVSDNISGSFSAQILIEMEGNTSDGKGEGHIQPDIVIDEATGDIYIVYWYEKDGKAYYHVKQGGVWSGAHRLLPEHNGTQGYFRNGPSVADIPGAGVVACVVNNSTVYLRTLGASSVATPAIGLNPSSLSFTASEEDASNPASQDVTISNVGGSGTTLPTLTASSNKTWLSVSMVGGNQKITNAVNRASATVGTDNATVTVSGSGVATVTYSVSLTYTAAPVPVANLVKRINAGGGTVSGWDSQDGFVNTATRDYSTTSTFSVTGVANAGPAALYQTCRHYSSDGTTGPVFTFPSSLVADGDYVVRLHFAEPQNVTLAQAAENRKMTVTVQGANVLTDFSPATAAGAIQKAYVWEGPVTVSGGAGLTIALTKGGGNDAFVQGIEIYTADNGGTPSVTRGRETVHRATGVYREASGKLSIVVSQPGAHRFQVFSLKGAVVASGQGAGIRTYSLNLADMPRARATYIARIVTPTEILSTPFVITGPARLSR